MSSSVWPCSSSEWVMGSPPCISYFTSLSFVFLMFQIAPWPLPCLAPKDSCWEGEGNVSWCTSERVWEIIGILCLCFHLLFPPCRGTSTCPDRFSCLCLPPVFSSRSSQGGPAHGVFWLHRLGHPPHRHPWDILAPVVPGFSCPHPPPPHHL